MLSAAKATKFDKYNLLSWKVFKYYIFSKEVCHLVTTLNLLLIFRPQLSIISLQASLIPLDYYNQAKRGKPVASAKTHTASTSKDLGRIPSIALKWEAGCCLPVTRDLECKTLAN